MTTDLPHSHPLLGWTDPTLRVQNIFVLKNGTSFIRHHAEQLNWQLKSIPLNQTISRFVILRDPFRRWLVGFTQEIKEFIYTRPKSDQEQILNLFNGNFNWFLEFLLDRGFMYIHTPMQLQVKFLDIPLQVLGKENITFFKMNELLGYSLNHWLHGEGVPNKFNNGKINATDEVNDSIFRNISTFFMDAKNIERKQKIMDYLQPDYELLNSVRFFNNN